MNRRSTQARLAAISFHLGSASLLLPMIVLLLLGTPDLKNPFWRNLAGLLVLATIALWVLHRIKHGTLKRPVAGWILAIVYFLVFLAAVWTTFDGPSVVFFVLGIAELGGLVASLAGLIHSIYKPDLTQAEVNKPRPAPGDPCV